MIKGFCTSLNIMPNFYHWRSLAGAEVDIIVEIDGTFYPIEVKTATTVSKNNIRGIETYPHLNIAKGIVIYARAECYRITEDTIAIP